METNIEQAAETTKPESKPRSMTAIFISIIALLLAAAMVLELNFNYRGINQLNHTVGLAQQEANDNQMALRNLSLDVGKLTQQTQQQQEALQELQRAHNGDRKSAQVIEAEDLAQLAQYNLQFMKNVPIAITLLQLTDQKIAAWNGASALAIRQQIASTLSALQAIPKIDVSGLLVRLQAVQQQIPQLPIAVPTAEKTATTTVTKEPNLPFVQKVLRNTWEGIRNLVVIQRHDKPIQPILPVQQQIYLQENLQLLIQQAQWAVLHAQQAIYDSSLNQANQLIQQYYDMNSAATQALLKTLADLQKITVEEKLPDVSPIIQAIHHANDGSASNLR